MCFRPAEADTKVPVLCRDCGKRINPVQDVYPEKCPFCKCDNPAEGAESAFSPNPPAIQAPAAPPAPKAPAPAPEEPSAPETPSATGE